jgi:hypothetical protein
VPRRRAVLLLWLLLLAWTDALYLRAFLDPPPGRAFAGTFHWIDDFYNYASYVQQAEDGAFLFVNKLLPPVEARPRLANLEWWSLGRVSLVLGRRPFLAYRLLAALATLALVAGVARWLERTGVPASHRLEALALVFFGGGLGGILFELTDLPVFRCVDLSVAAFPFLEVLANPHFTAGTALLVWALWAFEAVPGRRGPLLGMALGTVLGLVRPYDLGLLGAIRGGSVLVVEPVRRWPRALLPLAGLLPVLAYDLWLFFGSDQFASFRRGSIFPPRLDMLPAFGPAALLALAAFRRPPPGVEAGRARTHLLVWTAIAAAFVAVRPGAFSLQLLVGAGVPLLVLGAAALADRPARAAAAAALVLSTSAVVATRIVLRDDPNWFVPRERLAAGLALRAQCHQGDRLLAPPDISLYAIGLSACSAYVAHPAAPDYEAHLADARVFYAGAAPQARALFLDQQRISHFVVPGDAGPRPVGWLGPGTPFRAAVRVGAGAGELTIYVRERGPAAAPADDRVR